MHVIDQMLEAAGLQLHDLCPNCRKALKPEREMICRRCVEDIELARLFEESDDER